MPLTLSPDQDLALKLLIEEMRSGNPFVTLGGYAGTGKSTLIPFIATELGDLRSSAFCCYTGKAAQVLRDKLQAAGILHEVGYVGTIHGLIYQLVEELETGEMVWALRSELKLTDQDGKTVRDIRRIFVDEVSMVGKKLLEDLLLYGVQILAVGDPAQLPPIDDDSVIKDPDVLLTQIHRQAEGNPIIQLASHIRETGLLLPNTPRINYEQAGIIVEEALKQDPLDVAILARTNRARNYFNERIYGKKPERGHVVICLKNDWRAGVYNGLRGTIENVGEWTNPHYPWVHMMVKFSDGGTKMLMDVNLAQFGEEKTFNRYIMEQKFKNSRVGQLFDFGMAMTVHKSQGSGFGTVLVSPDHWAWNKNEKEDYKRWLYTAVTRATTNLHILPDWD